MDIVFKINDIEKVRYDYENEFPGEREDTRAAIAYENNCKIEDVIIYKQKRASFDIKVYEKEKITEYKQVNYKKCVSIIINCLLYDYIMEIKASDNKTYIVKSAGESSETLDNFKQEYELIKI